MPIRIAPSGLSLVASSVLAAPAAKVLVTSVLVGSASLAGRRWGGAVSGWLVGFPWTSAPIVFFLALNHGSRFAAVAAAGTLAGTASQAIFCLAYAHAAERFGWPLALASGCGAFAVATAAVNLAGPQLPVAVVLALVVLLVAIRLLPGAPARTAEAGAPPAWDIPLRMLVASAFVVLLTGLAAGLGPRLTGLLAPFPLYAGLLTVFAHIQRGTPDAVSVLRGLSLGLFAFGGFFLVVSALIEPGGIAVAFAAAAATALAIQGVSLWLLGRRGELAA